MTAERYVQASLAVQPTPLLSLQIIKTLLQAKQVHRFYLHFTDTNWHSHAHANTPVLKQYGSTAVNNFYPGQNTLRRRAQDLILRLFQPSGPGSAVHCLHDRCSARGTLPNLGGTLPGLGGTLPDLGGALPNLGGPLPDLGGPRTVQLQQVTLLLPQYGGRL